MCARAEREKLRLLSICTIWLDKSDMWTKTQIWLICSPKNSLACQCQSLSVLLESKKIIQDLVLVCWLFTTKRLEYLDLSNHDLQILQISTVFKDLKFFKIYNFWQDFQKMVAYFWATLRIIVLKGSPRNVPLDIKFQKPSNFPFWSFPPQ